MHETIRVAMNQMPRIRTGTEGAASMSAGRSPLESMPIGRYAPRYAQEPEPPEGVSAAGDHLAPRPSATDAATSWRRPSRRLRRRRRRAAAILGVPVLVMLACLVVDGLGSVSHAADGVTPTDIGAKTTVVVPAGWEVSGTRIGKDTVDVSTPDGVLAATLRVVPAEPAVGYTEAWDAAAPAQFRTEILASGLAVVHGWDGRRFVAAVGGEGATVLVDAQAVQDLSGYLPALADCSKGSESREPIRAQTRHRRHARGARGGRVGCLRLRRRR